MNVQPSKPDPLVEMICQQLSSHCADGALVTAKDGIWCIEKQVGSHGEMSVQVTVNIVKPLVMTMILRSTLSPKEVKQLVEWLNVKEAASQV